MLGQKTDAITLGEGEEDPLRTRKKVKKESPTVSCSHLFPPDHCELLKPGNHVLFIYPFLGPITTPDKCSITN